jgi:hypothetical protein
VRWSPELDAWKRDAIAGLGEPRAASAVEARQDRRRVKELERELHRKDKALAETAALLVAHQDLAIFQAGHASSPSWKTAESSFFLTAQCARSTRWKLDSLAM